MYVAYNEFGDLVATGDTYWEVEDNALDAGYDEWELHIGFAGHG